MEWADMGTLLDILNRVAETHSLAAARDERNEKYEQNDVTPAINSLNSFLSYADPDAGTSGQDKVATRAVTAAVRVVPFADGEPGMEQPFAARRGRVQLVDGTFLHFCVDCGRFGAFGYGFSLRRAQLGRWYCHEHRPARGWKS